MKNLAFIFTFLLSFSSTLSAQQINIHGGLAPGDPAPPINGESLLGSPVSWAESLEKGPVVVVFFRGTWCPYCSRYLKQVDKLLRDEELNATVIALAPQLPEFSRDGINEENYSYRVLYDEGGYFMRAYRSVSKTSQITDYKEKHPEWVDQYEDEFLPVPATSIINQNGIITAHHFDEDYTERMDLAKFLREINKLQK